MLPTFPRIEKISAQVAADTVRHMVARHAPMLGEIRMHIQHEGAEGALNRADGSVGEVTPRPIGAKTEIPVETSIYDFTPDAVLKLLDGIAEQFARGQSEMLFEEMDKVTAQTGNVVDGGGKPFSVDHFLEAIAKMDHSFNEDGTWNAPTVVAGSDIINAVASLSAGDQTQIEARMAAILEQKKREFLDREANRILAG